MKYLFTIIFLIFTSIPLFSQYGLRKHVFGGRVPFVRDNDFKYLDTIIYKSRITIDSIVILPNQTVDTFSFFENFRELRFRLSDDSIFCYQEPLSQGHLLNSKKYGKWNVVVYNLFGNEKSTFCDKSERTDLYLNDFLLFDVCYPLNNCKINLDLQNNKFQTNFEYYIRDSLILMTIECFSNPLKQNCNCLLKSDFVEVFNDKSEYLETAIELLFKGEYDRKLIYKR
jgi:hypothetical protein